MKIDEEAFEAWQIGPNELLLKKPSTGFTFLHDVDLEEKGKTLVGFDCECISDTINIARNEITNDPSRQFLYYRVIFPFDLVNSFFSPDSENGKITPKVVPEITQFPVMLTDDSGRSMSGTVDHCSRVNLEFCIAKEDKEKKVTKPKKKMNVLNSQFIDLFQNNVTFSDDDDAQDGSGVLAVAGESNNWDAIDTVPPEECGQSSLAVALRGSHLR